MNAVPILGGHHGHIADGKVFLQTVERGTWATASAGYHSCGRLELYQVIAGLKQAVKQGTKRPGRSGEVSRRTDDHTVGFFQFLTQGQIYFVLEYAYPRLLTFPTSDAPLYGAIAYGEDFCFDTVALQWRCHLGQDEESVAFTSEVSIILYLIDYQLYRFCKIARVTNVQQKSEKLFPPYLTLL